MTMTSRIFTIPVYVGTLYMITVSGHNDHIHAYDSAYLIAIVNIYAVRVKLREYFIERMVTNYMGLFVNSYMFKMLQKLVYHAFKIL